MYNSKLSSTSLQSGFLLQIPIPENEVLKCCIYLTSHYINAFSIFLCEKQRNKQVYETNSVQFSERINDKESFDSV